jgi:hypothetical protein
LDDHEPTGYYRWRSAQLGATQGFSVLHDRELTCQLYRYDPDGDAITAPVVSSPSVFSAQLISGPANGTVELNADGSLYIHRRLVLLARMLLYLGLRMV